MKELLAANELLHAIDPFPSTGAAAMVDGGGTLPCLGTAACASGQGLAGCAEIDGDGRVQLHIHSNLDLLLRRQQVPVDGALKRFELLQVRHLRVISGNMHHMLCAVACTHVQVVAAPA